MRCEVACANILDAKVRHRPIDRKTTTTAGEETTKNRKDWK